MEDMSASEIWLIQLLSKVEINIPQLWEQGVPGSVRMLENLKEYYSKSDGATKKKILGCIFSEKLVLEKGRVATSTFTEPIQLILRISGVLGSS